MLEHVAKELILSNGFDLPEVKLPTVLLTNVAELTALLHAQQKAYEASQREARNAIMETRDMLRRVLEQIVLSRRRLFGPSTEASGRSFV